MTTNTVLRCALGVGDRTLSDFRSDGLGVKEMERLRAHVAQCPSCQARLDEFEAMARALRAQPEPDGHAQLWRNVRASIAAESALSEHPSARQRRHARAGAGTHAHSTRLWAAFGSVAAVVALSAGFIGLFVSRGGWPPAAQKARSTPTANLSGVLTWRQMTMPQGFPGIHQPSVDTFNSRLALAPSDGKTGYSCQANSRTVPSPVVWATHDAGASWTTITPTNLPSGVGGCQIVVDANLANTLIISFYPMDGATPVVSLDTWVTYASFDGGATWTKPAGLQRDNFTEMQASARGKVYALRGSGADLDKINIALYMSGDGMRTWRQIDATLPRTFLTSGNTDGNDRVRFWVNMATGEVILETAAKQLWSTVDDGAHWTNVILPNATSGGNVTSFVANEPTTSAYLTICSVFNNPAQLYCTSDDGKTWQEAPSPVAADDSGGNLSLLGIGSDGSVYVVDSWDRSNQALTIFRLPPGATKAGDWQRLGAIPHTPPGGLPCEAFCPAFPSGQEMVFWLDPSVATTDSGTIVQPNYYVAIYP